MLGQIDEFKSLSYRNLPFLFLTKSWTGINKKKKVQEKQRFHQDGMQHSLNSYEALEEPFFRAYFGDKYIFKKSIKSHSLDKKLFDKYNKFRRLCAGDKIYLAKNNNHLLRAEAIHEYDLKLGNDTVTIIPFRDPYDQAKSLLKQHVLLSGLQNDEDFTLDYMDFLVHHEFGLHHKMVQFDSAKKVKLNSKDTNSIDYWLEFWFLFYEEVYIKFSKIENCYFFCYESFVNDPKVSMENLFVVLGMKKSLVNDIVFKKYSPKPDDSKEALSEKYIDSYNKLKSISIN